MMNLLQIVEAYQLELKRQGRDGANEWLLSVLRDRRCFEDIVDCFDDDGNPVRLGAVGEGETTVFSFQKVTEG